MARNKTGPRYFALMEKHEQVIALRRQGYTYREIQAATGMDSSNAARLIKQWLEDIPKEEADLLRQLEVSKLDEIALDAYDQAFEFRAELGADGKPVMEPVCDDNGLVLLDRDGQVQWRVRRDYSTSNAGKALLLKVHTERVKLLGLAVPVKQITEYTNTDEHAGEFVFRIVDARAGTPAPVPALPPMPTA